MKASYRNHEWEYTKQNSLNLDMFFEDNLSNYENDIKERVSKLGIISDLRSKDWLWLSSHIQVVAIDMMKSYEYLLVENNRL